MNFYAKDRQLWAAKGKRGKTEEWLTKIIINLIMTVENEGKAEWLFEQLKRNFVGVRKSGHVKQCVRVWAWVWVGASVCGCMHDSGCASECVWLWGWTMESQKQLLLVFNYYQGETLRGKCESVIHFWWSLPDSSQTIIFLSQDSFSDFAPLILIKICQQNCFWAFHSFHCWFSSQAVHLPFLLPTFCDARIFFLI